MQSQTQIALQPAMTTVSFELRCSADQMILNGQQIDYNKQILDLDKLYIIKTPPKSQLKPPIVLNRSKQIDLLDRRIFLKKFVFEIVKSLEICSIDDAFFIIKRVPKQIKFFISVIQCVTLVRWKQLIGNDIFFVAIYECLETLISKKQMSSLRRNFLEDLLNTKLTNCHSRLFYMLDNLVLENQDLRNVVINLNKRIVLEEIQHNYFFEKNLLDWKITPVDEDTDDQNSGKQDNQKEAENENLCKEMTFPDNLLQNAINLIRSCQRLKITKQVTSKKILNRRFFKIFRQFFRQFFQKQRLLLLEVLALASEFEPLLLWEIVFDEGRTLKCKNLKFLQLLLTNTMISYSQQPKRKKKPLKKPQNEEEKENCPSSSLTAQSWQFTSIILQKFISFPSPQRKLFLTTILNSLLSCKLISQQLECILIFLESSTEDQVYYKKNIEVWKMIVLKIEYLLNGVMCEGVEKNERKRFKIKKPRGKGDFSGVDVGEKHSYVVPQENEGINSTLVSNNGQVMKPSQRIHLPFSKFVIIALMKIYKVLVINENKFCLQLNQACLKYLLSVTQHRKGVIEGVRLTLIEIISQEQSHQEIEVELEVEIE